MKCEVTECGYTPNGLRVQAITDAMGAQVVVGRDPTSSDENLLSEPLADHQAAVSLGKDVVKHGIDVYHEWRGPINSLIAFAEAMFYAMVMDLSGN